LIFNPRFVEWRRSVENDGAKGKVLGRGKGEEVLKESSLPSVSFFNDRLNRAYLKAASTFGTFFVVDHIGFPFFNGFRRAFFCTGPASHTLFRNDISHWHHPL
jgi:hypothetical protein